MGICSALSSKCCQNNGYNLLTFTLLLTFCSTLMFITSVINTHYNYNTKPYRDWALAGGVTPTSANFRVRGPASDDGIKREFVLSTHPNLAIEKNQILVTPVSYEDFVPQEHFMKRISIDSLSPVTTYYYGITHPQSIPNSATMAGDVGKFSTPPIEGSRVNFTVATGACALTGSRSQMFANILDLNPVLFIHMGDFHYEDLDTLDIDERLEAYDKVMGSDSQRLLYMRTIFTYMWDDHDWLGNNKGAEDVKAGKIAKESYSLAIPHYDLGAVESGASDVEETAPKYQAFTIGTVRFIISDLRSESFKSTEDFAGQVYSAAQKNWLYNEFSQADNYDFVVWVTTRPWTDPDEVGSDSWGGFVNDRDDLSSYIASTIGAGPKNLLVLSGDNHMVAFDDGSSTDYSNQTEFPGGFPLLHSGPLTNFGSGITDFIHPQENYFTDGCHAINSEVNHQFSTVEFTFPADMQPCIELKSYAENADNVIFQTKTCGEIMRSGTAVQDVCTLPRLSKMTEIIFIVALGIIGLNLFIALWVLGFKKCLLAISYFGVGVMFFFATIAAAVAGAICFGTLGVNVFAVSIFTLAQAVIGSMFIGMVLYNHNICQSDGHQHKESEVDGNPKTLDNEEYTVERTDMEERTVDEENKPMKELISAYDSDDSNRFDVGVWEDAGDTSEHAFEVGMWEESSASEVDNCSALTDPTKYIEVEYMPNRTAR